MNIISFPKINVAVNVNNDFFSNQATGPWWLQLKQEVPSKVLYAVLTNHQNDSFVISPDHINFQKGMKQSRFLAWFETCLKTVKFSKNFPFMQVTQVNHDFHLSLSMPSLGLAGGDFEEFEESLPPYFLKKERGEAVLQLTKEKFFENVEDRFRKGLHPSPPLLKPSPLLERDTSPCKLQTDCNIEHELRLLENGDLWPFQKYMREALYNEKFGYYSSGVVSFGCGGVDSAKKTDFTTHAITRPSLAYSIATQAAMMYVAMREAGDLQSGESFVIHENAPGLGIMAHNILEFCLNNFAESSNPYFREFWKVLKYQAAEISPELIKKCHVNNELFIQQGKFEVLQADAYNLKEKFPKRIKGLILSNEIIDNAPHAAIRLNSRKEVEALTLAPCLQIDKAKVLLGDKFSERSTISTDTETLVRLRPEDFQILEEQMHEIQWEHTYVPIAVFPELVEYIKRYGIPCAKNFQEGKLAFLNTFAPHYVKQASELLDKGFVITIDYALYRGIGSNPDLRLYSHAYDQTISTAKPLSNLGISYSPLIPASKDPNYNLSSGMGKCDLTVSVDLKPLIEAGKGCGLNSLAVVVESDLKNVLPSLDDQSLSCLTFESENFFALIQQKYDTKAQFFIPAYSYIEEDIVNKARMYSHVLDQFVRHSPESDLSFFKPFFEEMTLLPADDKIIDFVWKLGEMIHSPESLKKSKGTLFLDSLVLIKKYDAELSPLFKQIAMEYLKKRDLYIPKEIQNIPKEIQKLVAGAWIGLNLSLNRLLNVRPKIDSIGTAGSTAKNSKTAFLKSSKLS